MTDEAFEARLRQELLALYAAIDAEGGAEGDDGPDFHRGYSLGLELALTHIDQRLNADLPPDEAWLEEGWQRFRARLLAAEPTQ